MKPKMRAFLNAYMTCSTVEGAARAAGIGKTTAYKYLKDPEFTQAVRDIQGEGMANAGRYLSQQLAHCSEILLEIIDSPKTAPAVKVQAINAVFANHRAITENVEIMERLEALEQLQEGRA